MCITSISRQRRLFQCINHTLAIVQPFHTIYFIFSYFMFFFSNSPPKPTKATVTYSQIIKVHTIVYETICLIKSCLLHSHTWKKRQCQWSIYSLCIYIGNPFLCVCMLSHCKSAQLAHGASHRVTINFCKLPANDFPTIASICLRVVKLDEIIEASHSCACHYQTHEKYFLKMK